jgi:L1 cell adhesion molecule like protein
MIPVTEMKRIIGRRFDDPVVQSLIENWPFDVSNSNGMPVINVNHETQKK